jgi:hypothetical protein
MQDTSIFPAQGGMATDDGLAWRSGHVACQARAEGLKALTSEDARQLKRRLESCPHRSVPSAKKQSIALQHGTAAAHRQGNGGG